MKNKGYWATNLFELQRYKNLPHLDDLVEYSRNFLNYVKELFPVNEVPAEIANSLKLLEQRIEICREQYEIAVERVCLEIQILDQKETNDADRM